MNKASINELRDFCNMVCDYMEVDDHGINPLHGYAINYGEIDWWAKKHNEMCANCMAGENVLADYADVLTQALYDFAKFLELERLESDVYKED